MTTNCRLREELEQARAALAALTQPLRVPFSDAQIEKMAAAARECGLAGGPSLPIVWRDCIRAALSAGGLEPCPVPEIDALRTKLARVSAKSARRRTAIKQLQKAHDGWRKLAEQRSERNKHLQQQAENRSKNYEELLKQRDILKIERDTFESAATKALDERDHRPTWEHLEKVKAEAEACDVARYAAEAQLDALHPGETIEGILCERDHYRIQLDREQEWVKQYKADRDDALAELAALRDEIDDDNTNAAAVNDLLIQVQNITAERDAALRERESVPVKVRWDVTAKEADDFHLRLQDRSTETVEDTHDLMDYLAAHAVSDVPVGVPSVEMLEKIGGGTFIDAKQAGAPDHEASKLRATAIRDAVLVGVAGEKGPVSAEGKAQCYQDLWTETVAAFEKYKREHRDTVRPVAPTDAQVEVLARVLHKAQDTFYCRYGDHATKFEDHTPLWSAEARAAFAHIGAVPGADPDAWKTPLELCHGNGNSTNLRQEENQVQLSLFNAHQICGQRFLYPADAARLALWLTSYAAAHGCPVALPAPERPKGLPTLQALEAEVERVIRMDGGADPLGIAESLLGYLAPFLCEPVGWELDVTWEELYNTYQKALQGNQGSWKAVLDLCRSRIRPVYECKECAALKQKLHYAAEAWRKIRDDEASDALNAALEGE